MNPMEAGKKDFATKMAQIRSFVVPDWNDLEIFYKQSMNMRDTGRILKLHSEGKIAESIIMTLIIKAMDKDENKLYVPADRIAMETQFCPDVISRVVTKMQDDPLTAEDATKN